jgi:hypothetical protein
MQDDIEYIDSLATVPEEDTVVSTFKYVPPVYTERKLDENFKKKYEDEDFVYEKKAKAKTWWDRFWEAVGRFFDWLFSSDGKKQSTSALIFKRIFAGIAILFVVYLIARAILNKEGMWIFGRSRKNINAQDITGEDIHQMDFQRLVAQTKMAGDHRLAVRYYFLWLLKKMSDREIIDWHWDKTNSDYLYEIKNLNLKKDFEYLTYVYDYSWYGDFPLDEKAFAKAERTFEKTLNTL